MPNNRVSTREFYDALINMDRRLGDKIDDIHSEIAANNEKFVAYDKRIDGNSTEIKKVRNLNTGIALLASTIAGIIGVNR
jgi:hypothetical protein